MTGHLEFVDQISIAIHDIDSIVSVEIAPYVANFSSLSRAIQLEATALATSLPAATYGQLLTEAWADHNELAARIGLFLFENIRATILTPAALSNGLQLYEEAERVEHRKRVMSAGAKLAMDQQLSNAQTRYNLSVAEAQDLCTPKTFWEERDVCHAKFVYAVRTQHHSASAGAASLAAHFHAGRADLMSARLSRDFAYLYTINVNELDDYIREHNDRDNHFRNLQIRAGYTCVGRDDLKWLRLLCRYDNYDEHLFGYRLLGLPDYFLRRYLIKVAVTHGQLDVRPTVLNYSASEVASSLMKIMCDCAGVSI